jgi:hypothetical protein
MANEKKVCIVDIKQKFRKKYLRQPSIDFHFHIVKMYKDKVSKKMSKIFVINV